MEYHGEQRHFGPGGPNQLTQDEIERMRAESAERRKGKIAEIRAANRAK